MEQDKETQRLLRKARQLSALVGTTGWSEAKEELVALLKQLDTISDLDLDKPADTFKFQAAVRKEIIRIMYNWISSLETKAKFVEKADRDHAERVKMDFVVRR